MAFQIRGARQLEHFEAKHLHFNLAIRLNDSIALQLIGLRKYRLPDPPRRQRSGICACSGGGLEGHAGVCGARQRIITGCPRSTFDHRHHFGPYTTFLIFPPCSALSCPGLLFNSSGLARCHPSQFSVPRVVYIIRPAVHEKPTQSSQM